jgi:peptidoglycan-N-acetylglucosamine deacetylase
MAFYRTPFWLPLLYPDFLWRIKTNEPVLYLTFDDGPVPGATDFVLQTLDDFNAKATFFCVGDNVIKHSAIYDKIISGGHRTGNHTHNHLNGWKTTQEAYMENFNVCQAQMKSTDLFRPPYGKIKKSQANLIKTSHKIVMWDVLSQDYLQENPADHCLEKTIEASRTGSIVVFHDSYKAEKNLTYVLPRYLAHFREKGFKFLTL